VQEAIAGRYPAPYFHRLHNTIRVLVSFFHGDDSSKMEDERLLGLARLVRLYACNARTLTHLYYLARHAEQTAVPLAVFPCGSVTVRVLLQQMHLRVEVLNARHLRPVDVVSRATTAAGGGGTYNRSQRRISHPKYNNSVTSSAGSSASTSSYEESLASSAASPYGTYPRGIRCRSKSMSADSSSNQSTSAASNAVENADDAFR
jgi:hypothetical protein